MFGQLGVVATCPEGGFEHLGFVERTWETSTKPPNQQPKPPIRGKLKICVFSPHSLEKKRGDLELTRLEAVGRIVIPMGTRETESRHFRCVSTSRELRLPQGNASPPTSVWNVYRACELLASNGNGGQFIGFSLVWSLLPGNMADTYPASSHSAGFRATRFPIFPRLARASVSVVKPRMAPMGFNMPQPPVQILRLL